MHDAEIGVQLYAVGMIFHLELLSLTCRLWNLQETLAGSVIASDETDIESMQSCSRE
jgi:hypothetical protein